ncbi:hypothetical protein COF80_20225 [Bacillus toyonensis]|uniref:hypothetical protein n=1 Tax=Bacillus toyonensis TaxID=155322 RepID=UPI000BF04572|nr:hypothetical protein [Bacillus toyonensis]PEM35307.1 hypothetical protein CN636_32155 [Bacillus toyonensis]PHE84281.1 hypothetical protein COF80_20225 [Bacillus toyonensis]
MNHLTINLNATFREHQVGPYEIADWMYLSLDRITEDYRELYEQEYTEGKLEPLEAIADALNKITNQCWWLLK